MKLNPDCVRDILLEVEDRTDFSTPFSYDSTETVPTRFRHYSHEELIYHIRQCDKAGLIEVMTYSWGGAFVMISGLTPEGHEFLANTRKNEVWERTKSIAEKVGSKSLDALIQISSSVIAQLINSHLGLPPAT